jgi:hypothetical protein
MIYQQSLKTKEQFLLARQLAWKQTQSFNEHLILKEINGILRNY